MAKYIRAFRRSVGPFASGPRQPSKNYSPPASTSFLSYRSSVLLYRVLTLRKRNWILVVVGLVILKNKSVCTRTFGTTNVRSYMQNMGVLIWPSHEVYFLISHEYGRAWRNLIKTAKAFQQKKTEQEAKVLSISYSRAPVVVLRTIIEKYLLK